MVLPSTKKEWYEAAWTCFVFAVIIFAVIVVIEFAANAKDPDGKWANSPFRSWFITQMQDERPASCCGEADGHVVQVRPSKTAMSGWAILVNGKWYDYDKKLPYHDNPTGENWAWYSGDGITDAIYFYCLRIATGT